MPQPKLKATPSASAKKPAASRASAPIAGPQSQPAAVKDPIDDEAKRASPPPTTTPPSPTSPPTPTLTPTPLPKANSNKPTTSTSTSQPTAAAEEDEELDNPLAFPQPLLTHSDIIARYLTVPTAKADLANHSTDPRWLDYCQLANTARAERNVWTIFSGACDHFSEKRALVWLDGEGRVEREWSFGQLKERIRRVAWWLSECVGVVKGERVVLCFVPGLDYFVGFWACLSLGVVAVPVCPPDPFQPVSDVSAKLESIMANCQPRLILSTSEYTNAIEAAKTYRASSSSSSSSLAAGGDASVPLYRLKFECIDLLPADDGWKGWSFPTAIHLSHGLSLAFLQYTSGSTGAPKGVMVGHLNVRLKHSSTHTHRNDAATLLIRSGYESCTSPVLYIVSLFSRV